MPQARNIATVGGATMLSRVLGFARDAGIAALFGSSAFAEAFFALLQFINFFRRLLAEGAVNGAFAPIWLRLKERAARNRFSRCVLLVTVLASLALAGIVVALSPWLTHIIAPGFNPSLSALTSFYSIYALPYLAFVGPVAVIAAALNAEGRVGAVAIGTIAFNAVMLCAVVGTSVAFPIEQFLAGIWLSFAITVASAVQLLIVASTWLWRGERFAHTAHRVWNPVGRFFRRAAPTMISAGIPQLKLLAGTAIASSTAAGVSWLYYANRLYELPLGIASVAIATVIVPVIAASKHDGKKTAFAHAQSRAFEISQGLALPAATAFGLLAVPIVAGLFQRGQFNEADTAAVAAALVAICAGLPGHVLEKVLAAICFAHEDAQTPMFAAFGGLAAAILLAIGLAPAFGHVGIAAAIAISGWIGASVLLVMVSRRRWLSLDRDARRKLPRIVLATIVMGAAIAALNSATAGLAGSAMARAVLLTALVASGLAIYLAALQVLGVSRIRDLLAAVRRRL